MKVRPLGDKIIVKRQEAESQTESGIFLPESAKDKPRTGTIVATGTGILNKETGEERRYIATLWQFSYGFVWVSVCALCR